MRTNTLALTAVIMLWAPLTAAQDTTRTLDVPHTESNPPATSAPVLPSSSRSSNDPVFVTGAQPVVGAVHEEAIEINVESLRRAAFVQAVIDALQGAGEEAPTRAELRAVFAEIDSNGDGVLGLGERAVLRFEPGVGHTISFGVVPE
jgi:hypothetical protein